MHNDEHLFSEIAGTEGEQTECTNCNGAGVVPDVDFEPEDCFTCDGTGRVTKRRTARITTLPIHGARALAA